MHFGGVNHVLGFFVAIKQIEGGNVFVSHYPFLIAITLKVLVFGGGTFGR